jgi:hypothetical protein
LINLFFFHRAIFVPFFHQTVDESELRFILNDASSGDREPAAVAERLQDLAAELKLPIGPFGTCCDV